jgi:hypothetical protein
MRVRSRHLFYCTKTQGDLLALLSIVPEMGCDQLEVETYTWLALPPSLREPTLADGIARELRWARERL